MMNKATDFSKALQDVLAAFPVDGSVFQSGFKTQAQLNEKMAKVAIEAAEKSTEISARWSRDSLAKFAEVTRAKADPAEYGKAASSFASASAELASETMAAFAEVAKKVQMETVELLLAAGKDVQENATSAMKKGASDMTAAPQSPKAPL